MKHEVEKLFRLLRKKSTGLKENSIILALDEQELILAMFDVVAERKYHEGYVDCDKTYKSYEPIT